MTSLKVFQRRVSTAWLLARSSKRTLRPEGENIFEIPKIRGPNMDPKIVGLLL